MIMAGSSFWKDKFQPPGRPLDIHHPVNYAILNVKLNLPVFNGGRADRRVRIKPLTLTIARIFKDCETLMEKTGDCLF